MSLAALPRITIFTRSYPPAYLCGGPARSVHAIVETLADEFRFSVITSAFDDVAAGPMRSVELARWSTFGRATTWYELRRQMRVRTAAGLLRATDPQLIYLNSFFDHRFSILPLLIARVMFRRVPVVLAPRGELSAGALSLKRRKKSAFIAGFRLLGLHKVVVWHASTTREKEEIQRAFGPHVTSCVAIDLRTGLLADGAAAGQDERIPDDPRGGSLVFMSRIVPKKNVAAVIQAMRLVRGDACLSIAGPIEDSKYWDECLELIRQTPKPERVKYAGVVAHDKVVGFLGRFDLFILPTLGENFGHVILESLAAGTPVITGRDTPWQHLETSGAGWLCDPADPEAIAGLINHFLSLDTDTRAGMRAAARALARQVLSDPAGVAANRSMFRGVIALQPQPQR